MSCSEVEITRRVRADDKVNKVGHRPFRFPSPADATTQRPEETGPPIALRGRRRDGDGESAPDANSGHIHPRGAVGDGGSANGVRAIHDAQQNVDGTFGQRFPKK